MNKDYTLDIRPIQNGFVVEKSWRKIDMDKTGYEFNYQSEKYMLADWNAVVEWLKNNELEVAPKAS